MRTTWNGSISFSLVTIPVGLAPGDEAVRARVGHLVPAAAPRVQVADQEQALVPGARARGRASDEIVKGWEVAKGQFVIVEDADLEAIERQNTSRSIDIERFVPLGDVDPVYFDRTYFLVPASAPAARRPYVLLLNVMKDEQVGAIGRFVLAGKEKLCLIRPKGDALVLETLYVAEDVYSQAEIEEAAEETKVKKAELDLARQLVDSLVGDVRAEGAADERVPAGPAEAARGEAGRPADRRAGAGARGAGDRPDGGAQEERRRGEGTQGACRRRLRAREKRAAAKK